MRLLIRLELYITKCLVITLFILPFLRNLGVFIPIWDNYSHSGTKQKVKKVIFYIKPYMALNPKRPKMKEFPGKTLLVLHGRAEIRKIQKIVSTLSHQSQDCTQSKRNNRKTVGISLLQANED